MELRHFPRENRENTLLPKEDAFSCGELGPFPRKIHYSLGKLYFSLGNFSYSTGNLFQIGT